mmetsp:Transcript_42107/g.88011  ORF Transcript_42107/g.88011 Transcript_42107/m.88011 type:complete len:213 (+) Transcript_42107:2678-3316(+)
MPFPRAPRRRRRMRRRSFATCASAPATVSPTCSSWWVTFPNSRARRSGPASWAWARASSSARPTTRTPTPRRSGPTASSGDTLGAFANGRKDDWDRQLPLAVFAINNAASTLGDGLTPSIDRGIHPRLPLSVPVEGAGESPALYARRMRELELTVRELLAAAQRKVKLDAGRVDTVFKVEIHLDRRGGGRHPARRCVAGAGRQLASPGQERS